MPSPPLSDDVLREAVEAKRQAGSELGAAKLLERIVNALLAGIAPEDLGREVELIGIMMQRRT